MTAAALAEYWARLCQSLAFTFAAAVCAGVIVNAIEAGKTD
jgi:hypothetical protein